MVAGPQFYMASQDGFTLTILDNFLAAGYYRMQHLIFTTNYISEAGSDCKIPVFWLRTDIKKIKGSKAASTIKNKCSLFSISIKKATINSEIENLYCNYKNSVQFNLAATCYEALHQIEAPQPYDSKMIEIRMEEELIAVGFFDCGNKSIAGILNIYNPKYKKYSLGKFLMLLKIDYAINENMDFYYTGYFSTVLPKFDYKIFPEPASIEVYLPEEKLWIAYEKIPREALSKYAQMHFAM